MVIGAIGEVNIPRMTGEAGIERVVAFLRRNPGLAVITGAGCSTGSGIPDYRDAGGAWKRPAPMTHQTFMGSAGARRRYWARSAVGWARVAAARPNGAHRALAALEREGHVGTLITQNVDGLHQRAASRRVIDLHGRLDRVRCMGCGAVVGREGFQHRLVAANPDWCIDAALAAPDGDADLGAVDYNRFQVPACERCGGVMKPDVVFFGDNVPAARVQTALRRVEAAPALLAVGTSLMVWSGYRFIRAAVARGIPCAAIGLGRTRADPELLFRCEADCATALRSAVERVAGQTVSGASSSGR